MLQKFVITDFKKLKVKLKANSKFSHPIYIKQHIVKEKWKNDLKPDDRTLYVVYIPPFATEESIKNIFNTCGEIEAVYFHKKPTAATPTINKYESKYFPSKKTNGYKVAYVVFKTTEGLLNALKLKSLSSPLFQNESDNFELKGYYKKLVDSEVDVNEIAQEIDSFMQEFDGKQKTKDDLDSRLGEPDEDGWITVTKKGRNPGFSRSDVTEKHIIQNEKLKDKKRYLHNFYKFQTRDSKLKHLEVIKRKFDEDKRKINLMKETRKFKPF